MCKEDLDPSKRLRFFDMYSPFVPSSRADNTTLTPTPLAEESVLESESFLPLLILAFFALLLLVISSVVCIKYRKRMPWYRGRSARLPSIEFDFDEVLAALEREKAMGNRETSPHPNRVVLDEDEEEEIQIIDNKGPPVTAYIPKEPRNMPKKPKRNMLEKSTVKTPKKKSRDIRNEARVIDEPEENEIQKSLPNIEKKYEENIYQRIDKEPEKLENKISMETSIDVSEEDKPEDALDKIKRSNFPKVLPDFPNMYMEFEGNSTHEKRIVPMSPGSIRKKYVPPSPPRVPAVLMPRKDRARNVVPNFLEFHSKLSTTLQQDESESKKHKGGKSVKSDKIDKNKVRNPSKHEESKITISQEENIDVRPRVAMETFSSNIVKQNAVSMESGIYFAQPAQVISDDNSLDSFVGHESDADEKDLTEFSNEYKNGNENELASLPPLLGPLEYFRRAEQETTLGEDLESRIKEMPSKLSQARQIFCKELEKVLQRQVVSQPNVSTISDLMKREKLKQEGVDNSKTTNSAECYDRGKITNEASQNYCVERNLVDKEKISTPDDQRNLKSTEGRESVKREQEKFFTHGMKTSLNNIECMATGDSITDEEINEKSISKGKSSSESVENTSFKEHDTAIKDSQVDEANKISRKSFFNSKGSSESETNRKIRESASPGSESKFSTLEEKTTPKYKSLLEDTGSHTSRSQSSDSKETPTVDLQNKLSDDHQNQSLVDFHSFNKSLEAKSDEKEQENDSKSQRRGSNLKSLESNKSSSSNEITPNADENLDATEGPLSTKLDISETLFSKDGKKSVFEKRKMFADSRKTDTLVNKSSLKDKEKNKSVELSFSEEPVTTSSTEVKMHSGEEGNSVSAGSKSVDSLKPSLHLTESGSRLGSGESSSHETYDKENSLDDQNTLKLNRTKLSAGSLRSNESISEENENEESLIRNESSEQNLELGESIEFGSSKKCNSFEQNNLSQESLILTTEGNKSQEQDELRISLDEKKKDYDDSKTLASEGSTSPKPGTSRMYASFEDESLSKENSPPVGSKNNSSEGEISQSAVSCISRMSSTSDKAMSTECHTSISSKMSRSPEPDVSRNSEFPQEKNNSGKRVSLLSDNSNPIDPVQPINSIEMETSHKEIEPLQTEVTTTDSSENVAKKALTGKSKQEKSIPEETQIGGLSQVPGKNIGGPRKGKEITGKTKKSNDKKKGKANKRGKGKP